MEHEIPDDPFDGVLEGSIVYDEAMRELERLRALPTVTDLHAALRSHSGEWLEALLLVELYSQAHSRMTAEEWDVFLGPVGSDE